MLVPALAVASARLGHSTVLVDGDPMSGGLDLVLSDSLKNKFLTRPLTAAEVKEMIQIPAPL